MTVVKERPQRTKQRVRDSLTTGRVVAFVLLVATCWAVLLATAPSPSGTPVLRSTSPGNAQSVKSPDNVLLTFDRPVPAGLATVRIISPPGEQVVFERPVHPAGDDTTISVPMPKARYGGTYAVAWTMPSTGLEPIGGAFTFDIESPTTPDGVPEIETRHDPVVATFHTIARFAALGAFALLAGAAFFVAAVSPASADSRSVRRLVKGSWWALVAATIGVFVSYGPYAAWAPLSDAFDPRLLSGTFDSGAGSALLTRLYVLVPATLALAQLITAPEAKSDRERRVRGATVLGCAAAVAATWSLSGGSSPLAVAVDVMLLLAVAVAAGGLFSLWAHGFRDAAVTRRFSSTAAVSAGVIVLAGVLLALWNGMSYAWLSGGLLVVVVLLVATGLLIRRAMGNRWLVAGAAGVTALVLIATSVLVVTQGPGTARAEQPASPAPALRDQAAPAWLEFDTGAPNGKGSLDLVLLPSTRDGQVRVAVHVSARDEYGATRDDVTTDAVITQGATSLPVPLSHAGTGYYAGSVALPAKGRWDLALTVHSADGNKQTLTQPMNVS